MALLRHMRIVGEFQRSGPAKGLLPVAFATMDRRHVDQHFGSAQLFAVYEIGPEHAGLLGLIQFADSRKKGHQDKLRDKLEELNGCAAVYCVAVGASAIRQLLARGIQPVTVSHGTHISDLVEMLQDELCQDASKGEVSGWVTRALSRRQRPTGDRFDAMDEEGWTE